MLITGMCYYVLSNIQPALRSTQRAIQLVACVENPILVKYGFEKVVAPFIKDVNTLSAVSWKNVQLEFIKNSLLITMSHSYLLVPSFLVDGHIYIWLWYVTSLYVNGQSFIKTSFSRNIIVWQFSKQFLNSWASLLATLYALSTPHNVACIIAGKRLIKFFAINFFERAALCPIFL